MSDKIFQLLQIQEEPKRDDDRLDSTRLVGSTLHGALVYVDQIRYKLQSNFLFLVIQRIRKCRYEDG